MKHIKTYGLFEAYESRFTYGEVKKMQSQGSMSADILFGISGDSTFKLKDVPIDEITIDTRPITISLEWYRKHHMDEDIDIIEKLMKMYENGEDVTPIVLNSEMDISDGIHRCVAQKELGRKVIKAFVQDTGTNESISETLRFKHS